MKPFSYVKYLSLFLVGIMILGSHSSITPVSADVVHDDNITISGHDSIYFDTTARYSKMTITVELDHQYSDVRWSWYLRDYKDNNLVWSTERHDDSFEKTVAVNERVGTELRVDINIDAFDGDEYIQDSEIDVRISITAEKINYAEYVHLRMVDGENNGVHLLTLLNFIAIYGFAILFVGRYRDSEKKMGKELKFIVTVVFPFLSFLLAILTRNILLSDIRIF